MENSPTSMVRFDISVATFLKVLLLLLLVYFVYQVMDILAILFVSLILATALEPAVVWLQRKHIPRSVSLLGLYLIIFLTLSLLAVLLLPPLVSELGALASSVPLYYGKLLSSVSQLQGVQSDAVLGLQQTLQAAGNSLAMATSSILGALIDLFGGIIQFIVMVVIAFYLVVDEQALQRFVNSLTPAEHQVYAQGLIKRIQGKLGDWFRGQLLLMAIIALMTALGLSILQATGLTTTGYILVLALWAGLTEIIPYLGPILGAVPAVLLALAISPVQALIMIVLYIVIQQLENNLVVPLVMKRTVGLNPIVSIVVILVGAKLGGIVGTLISIPLATVIGVVLSDVMDERRNRAAVRAGG